MLPQNVNALFTKTCCSIIIGGVLGYAVSQTSVIRNTPYLQILEEAHQAKQLQKADVDQKLPVDGRRMSTQAASVKVKL